MSLKEVLMQDLKDAMKSRDEIKKNTVQMVRAAVLNVEKDEKVVLDDEGVIEVIAKEVKKRKDTLPVYEKSGRQELINNLKREIEILQGYLPEQLTAEELEEMIKAVIDSLGITSVKEMGKIMAEIMPKVKGRAEGKVINEIVRKHLQ